MSRLMAASMKPGFKFNNIELPKVRLSKAIRCVSKDDFLSDVPSDEGWVSVTAADPTAITTTTVANGHPKALVIHRTVNESVQTASEASDSPNTSVASVEITAATESFARYFVTNANREPSSPASDVSIRAILAESPPTSIVNELLPIGGLSAPPPSPTTPATPPPSARREVTVNDTTAAGKRTNRLFHLTSTPPNLNLCTDSDASTVDSERFADSLEEDPEDGAHGAYSGIAADYTLSTLGSCSLSMSTGESSSFTLADYRDEIPSPQRAVRGTLARAHALTTIQERSRESAADDGGSHDNSGGDSGNNSSAADGVVTSTPQRSPRQERRARRESGMFDPVFMANATASTSTSTSTAGVTNPRNSSEPTASPTSAPREDLSADLPPTASGPGCFLNSPPMHPSDGVNMHFLEVPAYMLTDTPTDTDDEAIFSPITTGAGRGRRNTFGADVPSPSSSESGYQAYEDEQWAGGVDGEMIESCYYNSPEELPEIMTQYFGWPEVSPAEA